MDEASRMARAREQGYVDANAIDYRGSHRAPTSADIDAVAPAHRMNATYPDDFYSPQGARLYGDAADPAADRAVMRQLSQIRENPDAAVDVFRAVPRDATDVIQHGDWVTPSRGYAVRHGDAALSGDYRIIQDTVPARTLFTEGNSIYEFGYDAGQRFADGPASIPLMRSNVPGNLERSRFAAFDPDQAGSRNLLAGIGGGAVGLGLLASPGEAAAADTPPQEPAPMQREYPELRALDPTIRQRMQMGLADMFQRAGMSPYEANRQAYGFTGGGDRNMGMGLLDATPLGIVFGLQEGSRAIGRGREMGGIEGGVEAGLGLLEVGLNSVPAALATRPLVRRGRDMIRNRGN